MKKKLLHSLGSLFGLLLFAVALWVLHHELREYHYHDVVRHVGELPAHRLFLALALTLLSYLILTGYDTLAFRYIHHPLAYAKIALSSFLAYAFSHNPGLFVLSGAPVRYRLYSARGLSTVEITNVVAFCGLTFWLGFFTLGGMVFLLEPLVIPASLNLPFASVRPLGVIFLVPVGGYVLWSALRKRPLKIREWEFALPSPRLSFVQIVVASLDWALVGSILYVLLPPTATLSYPGFLGIFLQAQIVGLVSHVPGGLGVFETVMLLLLSPTFPADAVLGVTGSTSTTSKVCGSTRRSSIPCGSRNTWPPPVGSRCPASSLTSLPSSREGSKESLPNEKGDPSGSCKGGVIAR
ncbi:MAG: UPF0104 family protein [candidate division NC10 bacterium]|nr:UPF0104 family protein [candidate division NC10 bacterium]